MFQQKKVTESNTIAASLSLRQKCLAVMSTFAPIALRSPILLPGCLKMLVSPSCSGSDFLGAHLIRSNNFLIWA
jgi:hypothetical protein